MKKTPWGQISFDYSAFSFVPRWGGECEPISSDGHFLTDDLTVHMAKHSGNLVITGVVDDNQNFHHVDLDPEILKMLDLQGRFRYNESLKYALGEPYETEDEA
jgi:hypothetical protein